MYVCPVCYSFVPGGQVKIYYTPAQLQMCHRQEIKGNPRKIVSGGGEGGEGKNIHLCIDCIPISSVRLVVRDNGGAQTQSSLCRRNEDRLLQREGT